MLHSYFLFAFEHVPLLLAHVPITLSYEFLLQSHSKFPLTGIPVTHSLPKVVFFRPELLLSVARNKGSFELQVVSLELLVLSSGVCLFQSKDP